MNERRFVYHRANGPTYEFFDTWYWWLNDNPHRYYGYQSHWGLWYIHGKVVK